MKTIDLSAQPTNEGKPSVFSFINKLFPEGKQKQTELDAQNEVINHIQLALGDDFTLIRDIKIPGLGTSIPMALVGPPGVFVLYASPVKGTFRARGDAWLKLDSSGNMRNSNPNLPNRTRLYAEAIRKFLAQNGFPNAEIEAVLLFTEPEAFVENIKAPIRMVMCDGMESYSESLRLLNSTFTMEEQVAVVRWLSNPEGKLTIAEEISSSGEEITPQPVIMPSGEPPAADPVQEADFITEDVMRNAFVEQHVEPVDIPIPPVIEEAVEQAPGIGFSVSALLAKSHMSASQITILGAFALLDLLVICVGFVFVALNSMR
ncbi:MAG: hypothetical protein WBM17_09435 [Anaerolineales bacterium]